MGVKLLLEKANVPGIRTYDVYRREGGYSAAEKALKEMTIEAIVEEVKKSGLRGRGGAGFPAGMKWSFIAKPEGVPRHLVCNADESEPGTFKDRYLMEFLPHLLLEGLLISSFALGSNDTYIYIRGEYAWVAGILEEAIQEATKNGWLGKNILGTGFDCMIHVLSLIHI
jgi:NADH-quinone oxidoreductase subunit F